MLELLKQSWYLMPLLSGLPSDDSILLKLALAIGLGKAVMGAPICKYFSDMLLLPKRPLLVDFFGLRLFVQLTAPNALAPLTLMLGISPSKHNWQVAAMLANLH